MNTIGLIALAVVLLIATAFGGWRARVNGRFTASKRRTHPARPEHLSASDLRQPLGEGATLLQFSSAFCQPCRATRTILTRVAESIEGVAYVELDAAHHLELARRLSIMRTPTVLVLDSEGTITNRAVGQPRYPDVVAALGTVMSPGNEHASANTVAASTVDPVEPVGRLDPNSDRAPTTT